MQCACVILSFVVFPVVQYFYTFSHKRRDFRQNKLLCINVCFDILYNFETFLILRRTERDMVMNVCWFSCKVTLILVRFQWTLNFLSRFLKNSHIKFHENPSSGSQVFPCRRTNRRTDMMELIIAFSKFANAHKKYYAVLTISQFTYIHQTKMLLRK